MFVDAGRGTLLFALFLPSFFMAILSKKQQSCSMPCCILKWISALLLVVVAVAALVGVYQTHILDLAPMRVQFGSTSGSLSIIAFCIALVAALKQVVCCMSKCEVCSK